MKPTRNRIAMGVVVLQLLGWTAFAAEDAGTLAVQDLQVETIGGETFFRVTVNWPTQGVNLNFYEFYRSGLGSWSETGWAPDALALIPDNSFLSTPYSHTSASKSGEISPIWLSQIGGLNLRLFPLPMRGMNDQVIANKKGVRIQSHIPINQF